MKNRRKSMYAMMVGDKRSGANKKNFFLKTQSHKKESIKIAISKEISESLSNDIEIFTQHMVEVILEGILNGKE